MGITQFGRHETVNTTGGYYSPCATGSIPVMALTHCTGPGTGNDGFLYYAM